MKRSEPEFLKRLAELLDGDGWEASDLLVEQFPPEEYGEYGEASRNTDLYNQLQDKAWKLEKEHGIDLKVNTMRQYRATALAWPPDERSSRAPFVVHNRLRGSDRHEQMARYLKKQKGHPLTMRALNRYRAEDRPERPAVPWEAQVAKRIEAATRRALLEGTITKRPDWWNADNVTDDQREVVILALRDLATRMRKSA